MAFADAAVDPTIDYVDARGTSTPFGDAASAVIKLALGEGHAKRTPVSSTKGATGHCLGAPARSKRSSARLAIRDGVLRRR